MGLARRSLAHVQPWSKAEVTLFASLLTIDEDQHGSRRRQRREATLCAHRRGVVARCCMETNDAGARSSAPGPRPFNSNAPSPRSNPISPPMQRCERRWLVGSNRPRHAQSMSSPSPIRVTEDHAAMTPAHLYRLDLRLASDALSDTLLYRLAAVAGIKIN
jgi:hypothetical protein